jgi:outer membrane protein
MMKLKQTSFLTALILILCGASVFCAENIPKIGVINRKKVTQTYFKDSKALRDLDAERTKSDDYIKEQMDEIKMLESKRLDAQKKNDDDAALKLALDIKKKEEYIREYNRVSTQQYNDKLQKLYYSDTFLQEFLEAVERVAMREGISIVLDTAKSDILYYIPEVDITDKVIEELLRLN